MKMECWPVVKNRYFIDISLSTLSRPANQNKMSPHLPLKELFMSRLLRPSVDTEGSVVEHSGTLCTNNTNGTGISILLLVHDDNHNDN